MAYQLHTSIEIDAPVERVWQIFSRFEDYPKWNPFIKHVEGPVEAGAKIKVRLVPPGGRGITMRPTILRIEPQAELRWLGHFGLPGIFDGEHYFQLEPLLGGGTRFTQGENFSGILVPLLKKMIDGSTREGFENMNAALKETCERSN